MTLQPNSRHCFVCGLANRFGLKIRFYNQDSGQVVAEYNIPEQYQGFPGIAHGGIVAAMLDEAIARSQFFNEGSMETRFMVTAHLDIRYRRNVPVGKPLRLVGEAGKIKSRSAQAKAYLYDADGLLLAEAEGLLVDLPDELLISTDLDELGWKVYPEGEI